MNGVEALSDVELLAILLNSGTKEQSVLSLSTELIQKYQSIDNLLKQSMSELLTNKGIGSAKASRIAVINQIYSKYNKDNNDKYTYIKSSYDIYKLLNQYKDKPQENLVVVNLDNRGKVLSYKSIYQGTIDEMCIHPREIFNYALQNMAKSIIISHNHPSGNSTPSKNDIISTNKLIEISQIIGVKIIDHVIIAKNEYYSMRDKCDIIFS